MGELINLREGAGVTRREFNPVTGRVEDYPSSPRGPEVHIKIKGPTFGDRLRRVLSKISPR